jgi:16S rRNA C967 or C1407 C5-methylase (RsmB/RsmF family)/NOL1/NOP2/fmu family ribosome biogenesis protein
MPMSKYPAAFEQRMQLAMAEQYEAFMAALDQPSVTAIRTHLHKFDPVLHSLPIGDAVPWCASGHYLIERPSFTFDPIFHAGAYYVQESSSMMLEQAYRTILSHGDAPQRVLDLCAAPGGKSTHLLSLLPTDSLLVANELISTRNRALQQNLSTWGYSHTLITQNKAEDFERLGAFFDLIVIDAPCSGEGLFRRDKEAVNEWSEANVKMCSLRQQDILTAMMPCLLSSGYIIYSTCTFEPAENIAHIAARVAAGEMESIPIDIPTSYASQITEIRLGDAVGYSFYPHHTRGEGFFISLMRKVDQGVDTSPNYRPSKSKPEAMPATLASYISQPDAYTVVRRESYVHLIPQPIYEDYQYLSTHLYLRNAGLMAGEVKGRDFVPSHELAMSLDIRADIPSCELDYDTAIAYLRGENIKLPVAHTGWVAMRYLQLNLGWVKAMPNRTNNYYPTDSRIRKQI